MYEKKTAKNGRVMFYRAGKLISVKEIPEVDRYMLEGLTQEQAEELVNSATLPKTIDEDVSIGTEYKQRKVCIFCKETATTSKFINGNSADLCEEHYYSKTTGEIAAQVRNNGRENSEVK